MPNDLKHRKLNIHNNALKESLERLEGSNEKLRKSLESLEKDYKKLTQESDRIKNNHRDQISKLNGETLFLHEELQIAFNEVKEIRNENEHNKELLAAFRHKYRIVKNESLNLIIGTKDQLKTCEDRLCEIKRQNQILKNQNEILLKSNFRYTPVAQELPIQDVHDRSFIQSTKFLTVSRIFEFEFVYGILSDTWIKLQILITNFLYLLLAILIWFASYFAEYPLLVVNLISVTMWFFQTIPI